MINWMMGGVWGIWRVWSQIKTGTIRWETADGDIGWLLIPGNGNTNVNVSTTTMSVYRANFKAYIRPTQQQHLFSIYPGYSHP
ncbi:hypothetical protein WBJ53_16900 [Spirosoma sp. SC4-14]|uniref:hypothetical protein n=1 Tax=Spirosoma sp. SC4-14 TaxID=3128900 RepID=UPI0030D2FD7F